MPAVSLSAGMKTSLMSLQSTQKLIETTQEHMTTGRKVAKPSDDPAAYYAAVTLTDRAGDLSSRLDGMGQAVQAIKAADNGIQAMRSVLSNMKAVVENALTTNESDSNTRAAMGKKFNDLLVQLNSFAKDSAYGGINLLADDQEIKVQLGQRYNESVFNVKGFHVAGATEIDANGEVSGLSRTAMPSSWKLDANGNDKKTLDYDPASPSVLPPHQVFTFDQTSGIVTYTDADGVQRKETGIAKVENINGTVYTFSRFDADAASAIDADVTTGTGQFADFQGYNLSGATASETLTYFNAAGEVVTVEGVDGTAAVTVSADGSTITYTRGGSPVTEENFSAVRYGAYSEASGYAIQYFDDGVTGTPVTAAAGDRIEKVILDGGDLKYHVFQEYEVAYASEVSTFAFALNKVEDPNSIIGIKAYGTDQTTATGHEIDWGKADSYKHDLSTVLSSIEAIDEVLKTRSKLFSFDQSTITLREEYTKEFINTLETGSDKLTLADLNEEAANLLSLQTAQQLGVQAMSLSNQQTQSVLRLLQ